ncbi:MAG TPA: MurT ligase domain-containing protein [bacterium]|nr:MurT ligase domain-containing protein [bacterium]
MLARARRMLAIAAAKLAYHAARATGRGGGTAFPGLVAQALCPGLLAALTGGLPRGSLVVTGTNGKTTTTRMLSDSLTLAGWSVAHNRHGSNLLRGVTAAAALQSTAAGVLPATVGLWETDEAAFPAIVAAVQPRVIVITNLFRDQLDRYGETEQIRSRWVSVLPALPRATLVLNADDPSVATLGAAHPGPVVYFGISDDSCRQAGDAHASDVRTCRRCNGTLTYRQHFLSHLGDWSCPACGDRRPALTFSASAIAPTLRDCSFRLTTPAGTQQIRLPLAGTYNVYNALAAIAAASALALDAAGAVAALAKFQPAFGRFERLAVAGRELCLFLVKNPTGANAVLQTLAAANERQLPVLVAINDLTADGHDVSWLWDADFELLAGCASPVATAGIRGADMAVRLKYAGLPAPAVMPGDDSGEALYAWLQTIPAGATAYCLATYTAMLAIQKMLAARGCKAPYWKE